MFKVEIKAEIATDEAALRSSVDRPEGTIIVADKTILAVGTLSLPGHVPLVDLDRPTRLDRREKRALRTILKVLKKASGMREEGAKLAFVRSRLLRLRVLLERCLKLLEQVDVIGEADLRRRIDPTVSSGELDFLYFVLERFRGIDVARRIVRGLREFFL